MAMELAVAQAEGIDLETIVEDTWDEIGHKIKATGFKLWVRTLPHPRKVGRVWLPPNRGRFYGELPHLKLVFAVVLSVGPHARSQHELQPGTIVGFKRLNFAWWRKLEGANEDEWGSDDQFVGYLQNAEDVELVAEEESVGAEERFDNTVRLAG
jgi:hypothetical protein